MQDYIQERVLEISQYILETKATVRQVAKSFGVSKSTVHKDITERLPMIKPELAREIKKILNYNKAERHIRGGEATRKKYSQPIRNKQQNDQNSERISIHRNSEINLEKNFPISD